MINTQPDANNPSDGQQPPPSQYQPCLVNGDQQHQCCLVDNGTRCRRAAGNASYNRKIQKRVTQKKLKLYIDNSSSQNYICDHHKNVIQSARKMHRRKDSEEGSVNTNSENPCVDPNQLQVVDTLREHSSVFKVPNRPALRRTQSTGTITDQEGSRETNSESSYVDLNQLQVVDTLKQHSSPFKMPNGPALRRNRSTRVITGEEGSAEADSEHPDIDLDQLQINTLRRYKKHYGVSTKGVRNKAQLAEVITKHFKTIPVVEDEIATYFIEMIKEKKSRFDEEQQPEDH